MSALCQERTFARLHSITSWRDGEYACGNGEAH